MEQKTYDVFISYSRKDYVQNDKIIPDNPISAIIELFDKNGISYWIDKDGIFVGEEFVKEISKAIANSRMLVFVSSKNSNESEYTCGEILKAKKEKKQIIPFRIDKCDYNEKFEILLLPLQHVDYFEQCDAALSVLLCEVKREKKRIERIEADAEKQRIIEVARNEIKEKAKEYNALVGQQDDILKDLYVKNKIIGNTKKQCPVCENEVLIKSSFCEKCGWQFPNLYSLDGKKTPICDESQLALARAHWHNLETKDSELSVLQKEIITLKTTVDRKDAEIEDWQYKVSLLKIQNAELMAANEQKILYADCIIDDVFRGVSEHVTDDTTFIIKPRNRSYASFSIFKGAYKRALANSSYLDGCVKQILGNNAIEIVSKGEAEKDNDGRWRVIKRLSVIYR